MRRSTCQDRLSCHSTGVLRCPLLPHTHNESHSCAVFSLASCAWRDQAEQPVVLDPTDIIHDHAAQMGLYKLLFVAALAIFFCCFLQLKYCLVYSDFYRAPLPAHQWAVTATATAVCLMVWQRAPPHADDRQSRSLSHTPTTLTHKDTQTKTQYNSGGYCRAAWSVGRLPIQAFGA